MRRRPAWSWSTSGVDTRLVIDGARLGGGLTVIVTRSVLVWAASPGAAGTATETSNTMFVAAVTVGAVNVATWPRARRAVPVPEVADFQLTGVPPICRH